MKRLETKSHNEHAKMTLMDMNIKQKNEDQGTACEVGTVVENIA